MHAPNNNVCRNSLIYVKLLKSRLKNAQQSERLRKKYTRLSKTRCDLQFQSSPELSQNAERPRLELISEEELLIVLHLTYLQGTQQRSWEQWRCLLISDTAGLALASHSGYMILTWGYAVTSGLVTIETVACIRCRFLGRIALSRAI